MNLTADSNTLSGPTIAVTSRQMRSKIAIGFYDAQTGEKVYGDAAEARFGK